MTYPRLDRAAARVGQKRLTDAALDYQLVLQHMPEAFRASYGLALVALEQNDLLEAIKQFENRLNDVPALQGKWFSGAGDVFGFK